MPKDKVRDDRRVRRRYPLELDVEYTVVERGRVVATGEGRTANMSSGGVFFHSPEVLGKGTVELLIRWPATTDDSLLIELHAVGRVVRSDQTGTAVRCQHYGFQKLGDAAQPLHRFAGHCLVQ